MSDPAAEVAHYRSESAHFQAEYADACEGNDRLRASIADALSAQTQDWDTIAELRAVVEGLRTQLAEMTEARDVCSGYWDFWERAENERAAERDALASQVAAVKALAASYEARARNGQDYVIGRITVAGDIRAALESRLG